MCFSSRQEGILYCTVLYCTVLYYTVRLQNTVQKLALATISRIHPTERLDSAGYYSGSMIMQEPRESQIQLVVSHDTAMYTDAKAHS
jgi:hypothetical protein